MAFWDYRRVSPNMDTRLSKTELLSTEKQPGWVEEFARSAAYSGLQSPLKGLAQIVDKSVGTQLMDKVTFMDAPKESAFMSGTWHAQQLGAMVGMTAPFLLLHKGVGKCGNLMLGKLEQTAATDVLVRRAVLESAVSGAAFEGLCRPVGPQEDNFLKARVGHAIVGAATFGVLTRSALGIQSLMHAERGIGAAIIRSEIGSTMLSGIPAGLVNAELSSRFQHGVGANRQQFAESIYTFSVLGGTMAAGKTLVGGTHTDNVLSKELKAQSVEAREANAPTLGERLQGGLAQLRDALGDIGRPSGPQLALAEGFNLGFGEPVRATLPDTSVMHMSRPTRPLRGGIGDKVVDYGPEPGIVRPTSGERPTGKTERTTPLEVKPPEAKPVVEVPAKPPVTPKEAQRTAVDHLADVVREHQQHDARISRVSAAELRLQELQKKTPSAEEAKAHQEAVRLAETELGDAQWDAHINQKYLHPDRPLLALLEAVEATLKAVQNESPVNNTGRGSPRDQLAMQSRPVLEDLMAEIPGANRGAAGQPDLAPFRGLLYQDAVGRLHQLRRHLTARLIEGKLITAPADAPPPGPFKPPGEIKPVPGISDIPGAQSGVTRPIEGPGTKVTEAVPPAKPASEVPAKPTEAVRPTEVQPRPGAEPPGGDPPRYSRTVPGETPGTDIVITNQYMEFTHKESGQRMRLQFEHSTNAGRIPVAELQTLVNHTVQVRPTGEGTWQSGRLVSVNGNSLTVEVGGNTVVVERANVQVRGIRNSHVDLIYNRFVNPSEPRPFVATEDGAYVGQGTAPEPSLTVGTHTQNIAGRGDMVLPIEVLASSTLGSVLAGRTFQDLMPRTRATYEAAAGEIPLADVQGALGNGHRMRELFAATLRGEQPPPAPTVETPGTPGDPPGPSGGAPTPEGTVQRSPLSDVTVRALLRLAVADFSLGHSQANLPYSSLAHVASVSRNLQGTGGNPITPATARAAIGRAIELGHLTPTDTFLSLATRIDGLGQQALRYENLRRPGN